MSVTQSVRLNNGVAMPRLGLGTYRSGPGKEAQRAVGWALQAGYRLIDTSLAYWNEVDVGKAVADSGVARGEIFITTKLENDDHGYDATLAACQRSLDNLATDYIDLYLVHWPVPRLRGETWRAMERLLAEGRCRAIGVSNYTIAHLREVLDKSRVVPAVNQVEFHPFLYQRELLEFCRSHGIQLESYSPLVKGLALDHAVLQRIGEAHGKTSAQALLRWHLQHDLVAIPKSVHQNWIKENMDVWGFTLTPQEMQTLDALNQNRHIDWDPSGIR